MRIALLTRRFDPAGGGTERDLLETARALCAAGHELAIYAARSTAESFEGILIERLGWRLPRALEVSGFGLLAAAHARRRGAELTLSFGRVAGVEIVRGGGGSHLSYLHAARRWQPLAARARWLSPYHLAQCALERQSFTSARLRMVLAVSELVARDLTASYKIPPQRVAVIYNGVDLARFTPADPGQRRQARQQLGIEPSRPLILFVGNGFARKGLASLLRACATLAAEPVLLVAGHDRRQAAYQRLAQGLGIERRVVFLGPRQNVPELLWAADVLALPSHFEAFGNVAMEAMASGVAVVVSRACGAAELLPPALRPYAVENSGDTGELAAKLGELLKLAGDMRPHLRHAVEPFTWEAYGRNLTRLLSTASKR